MKLQRDLLWLTPLVGCLVLSCGHVSPPANPKPGQIWHDQRTNSDFCYCPPGTFLMGSGPENPDHTDDQGPAHQVTLTRGFWMGRDPVNQALWQTTMGANPASTPGKNLPVETVSWHACLSFLDRLNSVQLKYRYRLPTEAEWEYACRAGSPEPTRDQLWDILHAPEPVTGRAVPSGTESPGPSRDPFLDILHNSRPATGMTARGRIVNAWGINDMIGSVWQWCSDYRGPYPPGPQVDPQGPETGKVKVARGYPGGNTPSHAHSFFRWYCPPDHGYSDIGLRLVVQADR